MDALSSAEVASSDDVAVLFESVSSTWAAASVSVSCSVDTSEVIS